MDINKIIQDAKTKEKWSANHQFNYGPIEHLEKEIFNDGHDGIHFNLFYKNVSKVADALTFFAYEFRKYDIYVRITDLFYGISPQIRCVFHAEPPFHQDPERLRPVLRILHNPISQRTAEECSAA